MVREKLAHLEGQIVKVGVALNGLRSLVGVRDQEQLLAHLLPEGLHKGLEETHIRKLRGNQRELVVVLHEIHLLRRGQRHFAANCIESSFERRLLRDNELLLFLDFSLQKAIFLTDCVHCFSDLFDQL